MLAMFLTATAYQATFAASTRHSEPVSDFDLNEGSGIDDYLKYAALHNSELKAAYNRWQAARERIPQVTGLPDPQLSYAYYIENVETRVGPQEQRFGIAQKMPWFGKLDLRGDIASESAKAARQDYEKKKLALFRRVKTIYHDYWYLGRAVAVTEDHMELLSNLESVARNRYKAGVVPNSAVIQAQVELGRLEDRLRSLKAMRGPLVASLNAAMNRSADSALPWPRDLPAADAAFDDEDLRKRLKDRNPDLIKLDHLVKKEGAGIELARKERYPDISLGVDYIQTGEAVDPSLPDSGKDPVMGMFSINLPIWYGKYKAAEEEAYKKKLAAQFERMDVARNLEAKLEMALYDLRDAERKIGLYGDTLIPKAEQSLEVTLQSFESGDAGFISLIDAERLLLEFRLALYQAQAAKGKSLAQVDMLVGGFE